MELATSPTSDAAAADRNSPSKPSNDRSHRHSSSRRKHKSSSRKSSSKSKSKSNSLSTLQIRECACGRGLSCIGMTQAFRLLNDPRCYYVELPRYRENPPAYKYFFRNSLRLAYIRHLQSQNESLNLPKTPNERRYVALHHFHPHVIQAFYKNPLTSSAAQKHKVPISITQHELLELGLKALEEDRILSVTGKPTGGFYFCPSYSQQQAHDDLKALIKQERALREQKEEAASAPKPEVPTNIEITRSVDKEPSLDEEEAGDKVMVGRTPAVNTTIKKTETADELEDDSSNPFMEEEEEAVVATSEATRALDAASTPQEKVDEELLASYPGEDTDKVVAASPSVEEPSILEEDSEFDTLWENNEMDDTGDHPRRMSMVQEGMEEETEVNEEEVDQANLVVPAITKTLSRDADHPWQTPKYRRHKQDQDERISPKAGASPAQLFIDPTAVSSKPQSVPMHDDISLGGGEEIEEEDLPDWVPISQPQDKDDVDKKEKATLSPKLNRKETAKKSAAAISAALSALKTMDSMDDEQPQESAPKADPPAWKNTAVSKIAPLTPPRSIELTRSYDSVDSQMSGAIPLSSNHHMPGADPTMRIQVHNDLIAWESKRRTDIQERLEHLKEWWQELRGVTHKGMEEMEFAMRFMAGFSKAGTLFANCTQDIYDDKSLDDTGNAVNNSFLQGRLYKKRTAQELTIEAPAESATSSNLAVVADSEGGKSSTLLSSILAAQLSIAQSFRDTSSHIDEEILPEMQELQASIARSAKEYERLGDNMLSELKRSEIELKSIWDVFDAMVTGDLMEYTVHGSLHGSQHGSQHGGGSLHSFTGPGGSGSLHGVGESPVVSSMQSPVVKSTFRQLGSVEDGWLVEMYYRSAVVYQEAVISVVSNELHNISKQIINFEKERLEKLHQLLLSFVPRQRRLFNALPDQFKAVLDDLVGLRIDEETLQMLIDDSIKGRSRDHLKKGASHRSAIMNRSRISNKDNSEATEMENIESIYGNPFKSPRVLLSRVVGLQSGGLRGMVAATWKEALVVATLDGNLVLFTLPEGSPTATSPLEAFEQLRPRQTSKIEGSGHLIDWSMLATSSEKLDKNLTPTMVLSLLHCKISIFNKGQPRQLQIVEDASAVAAAANEGPKKNRFFRAMRAAADSQFSKKCTVRLPSASDASEWMEELERTKKVVMKAKQQEEATANVPRSPTKKRFPF